jgi:DNA-binding winged helix-turn-helix (wHTH) protein
MDAVYGIDELVLDRTIDVHVGRLRDKLGDDAASPRYIATIRGVGYRAAPLSEPAAQIEPAPPSEPAPQSVRARPSDRAPAAQ